MVTICWAAKGGSGTTVVATTLALSAPTPALLVDLDGDIPAVLGLAEPDRPGVADWLATDAAPGHLEDLLVDLGPGRRVLHWRSAHIGRSTERPDDADPRWAELGAWLQNWSSSNRGQVTVDAGTGAPPSALVEPATRSLLVTRPCYLALREAVALRVRPDGIVMIDEPGRGLRSADVEHALGAPVVATVPLDPAVARAVDAGLLASRPPRTITRELRRVAA